MCTSETPSPSVKALDDPEDLGSQLQTAMLHVYALFQTVKHRSLVLEASPASSAVLCQALSSTGGSPLPHAD